MMKLSKYLIKKNISDGSYIIVNSGVLYYKLNYVNYFRFAIKVSKNASFFSSKRNKIKRKIVEIFRLNNDKFIGLDIFFFINQFESFLFKRFMALL